MGGYSAAPTRPAAACLRHEHTHSRSVLLPPWRYGEHGQARRTWRGGCHRLRSFAAHGAGSVTRFRRLRRGCPADGSALCRTSRSGGLRWPATRLADALRQHGRATEVLSGRHVRRLAVRHAGRQTGRRLHLHQLLAWGTGNHAAFDDAAAATPRHAALWPALSGAGTDQDHGRRNTLWRLACRRPAGRAGAG